MRKAIKDSKWYWWIPLVYFIFLFKISKWTFEPDSIQERADRGTLCDFIMLPSLIIIIIIISIINIRI